MSDDTTAGGEAPAWRGYAPQGDVTLTVPEDLRAVLHRACRAEGERLVGLAARDRRALDRMAAGDGQGAALAEFLLEDPEAPRRRAEASLAAHRAAWDATEDLSDILAQRRRDRPEGREAWWARELAQAVAAQEADLAERDRESRAREARAQAAEAMSWQAMAEALWGPDYRTPLAIVARMHKRTVERACAGERPPPPGIAAWLAETMERVPEDLRRPYGYVMRGAMMVETGAEAVRLGLLDLEARRLP